MSYLRGTKTPSVALGSSFSATVSSTLRVVLMAAAFSTSGLGDGVTAVPVSSPSLICAWPSALDGVLGGADRDLGDVRHGSSGRQRNGIKFLMLFNNLIRVKNS